MRDQLAKPLHEEELLLAVRRALASFAFEAGWKGLRERMLGLEAAITDLWEQASGREAPEPEALPLCSRRGKWSREPDSCLW